MCRSFAIGISHRPARLITLQCVFESQVRRHIAGDDRDSLVLYFRGIQCQKNRKCVVRTRVGVDYHFLCSCLGLTLCRRSDRRLRHERHRCDAFLEPLWC